LTRSRERHIFRIDNRFEKKEAYASSPYGLQCIGRVSS
jgi:hypothetical protein